MKKIVSLAAILLMITPAIAAANPKLAVVSYWGQNADNFSRLPDHSLALINPDSGIFKAAGQTQTPVDGLDIYKDVVRRASKHDISLYGYVPTGYFNHTCNQPGKCQTWDRIEAQVKAYFETLPGLQGIFFDETAPADYDCEKFGPEYEDLRVLVARYKPDARIIFNVGMPDTCAVAATSVGEMIVLFENDGQHYVNDYTKIKAATDLAASKGVKVWHIVNNIPTTKELDAVVQASAVYRPDYLYVVDVSGDWQAGYNTYGDLPAYWKAEVKALDQTPEKQ